MMQLLRLGFLGDFSWFTIYISFTRDKLAFLLDDTCITGPWISSLNYSNTNKAQEKTNVAHNTIDQQKNLP